MRTTSVLSALAAALLLVPAARGQEAARPWRAEAEVGGTLFFGNTSATTLAVRTAVARADSVREVSVDGRYTYGRATDPEGDPFVNKRSWAVGLTFDHHPFERWSPFVFGRVESSLEQRLDARVNAGVGGKYTIVRSDRTTADASLAILGEHTDPAGPDTEAVRIARWSARLRGRRVVAEERLTLAAETLWKPNVGRLEEFTLTSSASVGFVLTDRVSLKLSVLDGYDSEAIGRGARSNHDGQLLVSVLSVF